MLEGSNPLGHSREDQLREQMLVQHDGPAFVRRAKRVEIATQLLFRQCQRKREELLSMARLRMGQIYALAGDWDKVGALLADDAQLQELQRAHRELAPKLQAPIQPTSSSAKLQRALEDLIHSFQRFNQRWESTLLSVDLSYVNGLREGYNLYYVLEKECATRSPTTAKRNFTPLTPITLELLRERFPLLPIPVSSGTKGNGR